MDSSAQWARLAFARRAIDDIMMLRVCFETTPDDHTILRPTRVGVVAIIMAGRSTSGLVILSYEGAQFARALMLRV